MSKQPQLTPWFDGEVKPARDGVYERDHISWGFCFSRYADGVWMYPAWTAEEAAHTEWESDRQTDPWRGLTAPSP